MADRSVVVRLRAEIGQYQASLAKASASTREFGKEITGQGKTARADIEKVGRSALVLGGVMAIGFGKAIQVGMGFEKQMSGVRAVSGATADEMDRLSDAALAAGASQKLAGVTASDAAAAEAELVKAGVSVNDVLGGALMGSLTLAAAGQIDFANAATIAAQAMNIFDLSGRDVTHVADLLAAAANKSAGDVTGFGDALRQGGLVAAQTDLTLEETVATLAAFADSALIGSDAGTSLKTMLQRLTPISEEAASLMDDLGFSAYDAQGNFIGLEGLAGELQTSMAGMTVEQRNLTMATLFGSDAVRGANVLYSQGAVGMRDYIAAVDDEGAAARMAAIQNDNLAGDVEALGGAFETALIENGSKANDVLRWLTRTTTGLVTGFSSMPAPVQTTALGLGAVATAGTLVIGAIGTLAPKAGEAKKALEGMGTSGAFLARNLKTIGGAIGVAGAGFAVFATWEAAMASARAEGEKWAASWKPDAFASAEDGLEAYKDKLSDVNFEWARMSDETTSSKAPWDADKRAEMQAGVDELDAIGTEMARVSDLSGDLAAALGVSGDAALEFVLGQQAAGVDILADDYDAVASKMRDAFGQMPAAAVNADIVTGSLEDNAEAAEAARDAFEDLQDAYRASVDPLFAMLDAAEANRDALAAQGEAAAEGAAKVKDANDAVADAQTDLRAARGVKDNAAGIAAAEERLADARERLADANADAAITSGELARMDQDAAESALDLMLAAQDLAFEIERNPELLDEALAKLREWTEQGSLTETQAFRMAGQFLTAAEKADILAGEYTVTLKADDQASKVLDALIAKLGLIQGSYIATVHPEQGILYGETGGATGGMVSASGMGRRYPSDTVPVWLTPGEGVVSTQGMSVLGAGGLSSINSGRIIGGGASGSNYDYSQRNSNWSPVFNIAEASPQAAAGAVQFRLRRIALEASA